MGARRRRGWSREAVSMWAHVVLMWFCMIHVSSPESRILRTLVRQDVPCAKHQQSKMNMSSNKAACRAAYHLTLPRS